MYTNSYLALHYTRCAHCIKALRILTTSTVIFFFRKNGLSLGVHHNAIVYVVFAVNFLPIEYMRLLIRIGNTQCAWPMHNNVW